MEKTSERQETRLNSFLYIYDFILIPINLKKPDLTKPTTAGFGRSRPRYSANASSTLLGGTASNDYFPLSSAPSLSRVSFMSPRLSPFLKLSTALGLSPMAEYRSPRQS